MRWNNVWNRARRWFAVVVLASAVGPVPLIRRARAGERQFLVILAHSPKQFGGGLPAGGLPNPQVIDTEYFDTVNPNVDSFAEYWEEISYGDVRISASRSRSKTTEWILLPWPIGPQGDAPFFIELQTDPNAVPQVAPVFEPGLGEEFDTARAMVGIDLDGGSPPGDTGPASPGPGSGDTVWKPGERFVDLDGDGRWDALDEANNQMDFFDNATGAQTPDGRPDLLGPWIDLDGDGAPPSNQTGCVYLPDSDNDSSVTGGVTIDRPDCCPNGPGGAGCAPFDPAAPDAGACPATTWTNANGVTITDCNGNLIDDAIDIALGTSTDVAPRVDDGTGCNGVSPNGIPDECEFAVPDCTDQASVDSGACTLDVCVPLTPARTPPPPRCEFDDANGNGTLDIVEPFENFLRRWDVITREWVPLTVPTCHGGIVNGQLCTTDADCRVCLGGPNADQPCTTNGQCPLSTCPAGGTCQPRACVGGTNGGQSCVVNADCPGGTCQPDLTDRTYIINNYQGNDNLVLSQSATRALRGAHDPMGKLGTCTCPDGTACTNIVGDVPDLGAVYCIAGGHAQFDPPDSWTEVGNTKMNNPVDNTGIPPAGFITSQPSWYQQAWVDRYQSAPPAWTALTPIFPATPLMQPLDTTLRRCFQADSGGVKGDGTGWIGCDNTADPQVVFVTSGECPDIFATTAFDQLCNAQILPEEVNVTNFTNREPLILYDGPREFDDLPSSKYHRGGDQRLGEVTSPFSGNIWGEDRGLDIPGIGGAIADGIIPAAGPYATQIHGNFGHDAGNLLHMELLTWAAPTQSQPNCPNCGDTNLDGVVDQGEVPTDVAYNYSGGPEFGTGFFPYPWNRNRVVEDTVEVLDDVIDFDDFVDTVTLDRLQCSGPTVQAGVPPALVGGEVGPAPVTASGVLSGVVLLPPGSPDTNDFRTVPFFLPIHNEDGLGDPQFLSANLPRVQSPPPVGGLPAFTPQISWNLFFHNWVRPSDGMLAGGDQTAPTDFQARNSAQVYLFTWEGFPLLFDFDVFDQPGPVVNCPLGMWDIMASGAMVHPVPILKENACTGWTKPVDLASVLTPGVDTVLTLPAAEFVRDDSYYFLENDKRVGERYYFWSAGVAGSFDEPRTNQRDELVGLPAEGMLVLHTDVGPAGNFSNPDALSQQQRSGTRPGLLIVQADGNNELQACSTGGNTGDAGDPWPGSTGATRFGFNTVPSAAWFTQNSWTGIDVLDVVPDGEGSVQLTINWVPTTIPSLRFLAPPAGQSVGGNFTVRFEATDVFGGTTIEIYFTEDKKTCTGSGAACDEHGDCPSGQLCTHNTTIGSSGVTLIGQTQKTTPGTNELSMNWNVTAVPQGRYVLFAHLIPGTGLDGTEDEFTTPRGGRNNAGTGSVTVSPCGVGSANCKRSRLETWTLTCINPTTGEWRVNSTLTQPVLNENDPDSDPYPHALTGVPYRSTGGEVTFTINQTEAFGLGDTFRFTTTGITAVSASATVAGGEIAEGPTAVIRAAPLSGPPPLTVEFDGRGSIEPNGEPLDFDWDFGDGSAERGAEVSHTYNQAGKFTATLRVTNPNAQPIPQSDEASVDIQVINNSPKAVVTASPTSGRAPLEVEFDATQSSDTETKDNTKLIYQWDFDDGTTGNNQGTPGILMETSHTFSDREDGTACTEASPCTFNVVLTVTDEGGASDQVVIPILVGNTAPVASFTASPLSGPAPLLVEFDASNSSDADGDTLTIEWDWGDGSSKQVKPMTGDDGTGIVRHTYSEPDTYEPTATAIDARGARSTPVSLTIEVTGNRPPDAVLLVDPEEGFAEITEFRFDGTRSSDRDGSIVSYRWEFGDGETGVGPVTTHVYERPSESGSFQVRLTVTDDRNTSDSATLALPVGPNPGNRAPVAHIPTLPTSCVVPCNLRYDGTLSFDPDGDELGFEWEFRTGAEVFATRTEAVVDDVVFVDPGLYSITLIVKDGRGGVAVDGPAFVTVVNRLGELPGAVPGFVEPQPEQPIPDSARQRPPGFCGLGMIMSLFGSLLGLTAMAATRRRSGS